MRFEISSFIASIKEPHLAGQRRVVKNFRSDTDYFFFFSQADFCSLVSLRARLNYESRGLIMK